MKLISAVKGSKKGNIFLLVLAAGILVWSGINFAGGGGSSAPVPEDVVKFEEIPGSTIKRVILGEKSVERLGVQTQGKVGKEIIYRTQVVGGRVVPVAKPPVPPSSRGRFSFSSPQEPIDLPKELPKGAKVWIQISLSEGELSRLDKGKPARILPLQTRKDFAEAGGILASLSKVPPYEDIKRSMLTVYYEVSGGQDHGLNLYDRVRVVLPVTGSEEPQLVVPYSSVYYDAKGGAWVFVNPSPLAFERQPIEIKNIEGNWAVLASGPPVGATVVTVGAPLLYGAEVIFKK